jgi:predicted PhzF superfamily epimerase YddE/YHI9
MFLLMSHSEEAPAAVCIIENELLDEIYLNIAAEINLRETAYPLKIRESE